MRKKHYVAYGSNLNIEQMARRCPGAKLMGTGVIKNYELQFKGREGGAFATISPKLGAELRSLSGASRKQMSAFWTDMKDFQVITLRKMCRLRQTASALMQWHM